MIICWPTKRWWLLKRRQTRSRFVCSTTQGKTAVKHLGCFVECLLRKSCIVVVGNFSGFLFVCLFNNSGKVAMTPLLLWGLWQDSFIIVLVILSAYLFVCLLNLSEKSTIILAALRTGLAKMFFCCCEFWFFVRLFVRSPCYEVRHLCCSDDLSKRKLLSESAFESICLHNYWRRKNICDSYHSQGRTW